MNGPDPFAVDEARWLQALQAQWGRSHLISVNGSVWYAAAADGSEPAITANSPGELNAAMHAAWSGSTR